MPSQIIEVGPKMIYFERSEFMERQTEFSNTFIDLNFTYLLIVTLGAARLSRSEYIESLVR